MKVERVAIYFAAILTLAATEDSSLIDIDHAVPRFPDIVDTKSIYARSTTADPNYGHSDFLVLQEFHDLINKRGRLDWSLQGEDSIGLYDDATLQFSRYQVDGSSSVCRVVDAEDKMLPIARLGDFEDNRDLPMMMGSLGIWRKVSQNTSSFDNKYYKGTRVARGISCNMWEVPLSGASFDVTVKLYFMSKAWKRAEEIDAPIPVRFRIDGTLRKTRLSWETDFFLFEKYDETWRVVEPILGVGCTGRKISPTAVFPGQDLKAGILKQYAVTAEIKVMDAKTIHRYDLYVDNVNKIIRHDQFQSFGSMTQQIEDMRSDVAYTFVPGSSCKIGRVKSLSQDDGFKRLKTVKELLTMEGEFYYLGTAIARGVVCDVWERVVTEYPELRRWDGTINYPNKIVLTYFFNTANTAEVDSVNPKMVQALVTAYVSVGYGEKTKYVQKYQMEISFFNFRPLYFGRTYENTFSVQQCFFDPTDRLFLEMFVRTTSDAEIHIDNMKQAVVSSLTAVLDVSPLRIGEVDIVLAKNGFLINLLVLGKTPSSASFSLSDYSDNVPTVWDKGPYLVDENECAEKALKEKENGYLLCDGTCYVMGRSLKTDAKKIPGADEIKCKTYVIVNPGSDAQTALNEPDLDEIKKTLEDLVLKKTLSFTVSKGSEGKDVPEASYIVDNMQVAPSIMRRTEQQKFVQTFTGSKIKSSSETALVKPEAETLGACYRQCVDDESMNCQSFSFCHLNSKFHCTISSNRLAIGLPKSDLESYLEPDTQCSVYNVPYINRYIKLGDKTAWMLGGVTVDSKLVKDVDDCAQQCSKSTPDSCESFQYCSTGHCIIHKEHYHDLGDSGKKLVTDDDCDFYSQNYLLDYTMAGSDLVAENTALEQFAEVSADLCAQRCSKRDDCVSMNYCPGNTNSPSRCSLNSKSVFDSDTETVSRPLCRTYEKIVEKPPQPKTIQVPKTKKDTSGFSGVGFFSLVLVMFASGIGLGVGAFIAMNRYRVRSGRTESSLNIFVKFSRREGETGQNETQDF